MLQSHQISAKEYQAKRISLLPILVAQQLVLLPLYFYIPSWIFFLNIMITAVVYFGTIRRNWRVPKWFKVALTAGVTIGVFWTFHRLAGRDAGVALISIMYGLKILEVKTKRDVYVLMLLGFFILLSGFLFDQSPLIAIYQLLPIAAIFNALTSIHSLNISKSIVDTSFSQLSKRLVKYFVLAIPLMIILFVFFPRLSGPIWKMPGGASATSGISDTMSPGAVSSLQLFDKIAFRVKFDGVSPDESRMYWRSLVLDDFDGLTWSRNANNHKIITRTKEHSSSPLLENGIVKYEVSLEKTRQQWLTFLEQATGIPKMATRHSDYSIQVPFRINDRLRYKGESNPNYRLDSELSKKELKVFTQLPRDGNSRSRNWALEERSKHLSDRDYISSVLSEINRQEYFYTLTPPIMERDTVDSFWLDEKVGFC